MASKTVTFASNISSVGTASAPDGPAHIALDAADASHKGFSAAADLVRLAVADTIGLNTGACTVTVTVSQP